MAQDETTRLFYEEVAEKKSAARGARHRASRTGKIGKVNLPADFLGRSYTKSSPPVSFSVEDVLYMLQETPTLKELLMQRLDAEYEHYKLAIERTIDAVARIQENALTAVMERVQSLEEEIRLLQKAAPSPAAAPPARNPRGKSLQAIRDRVFPRLANIIQTENEPDFKAVTAAFPGIRYYIYQLKIWPSFREMLVDFRDWQSRAANGPVLELEGFIPCAALPQQEGMPEGEVPLT